MRKTRAAIFHEPGAPDVVRIEDVQVPDPGPGQVRIEVQAAALNHLDLWARRGLPGVPLPHIGGSDIAGTVESIGDGVADWHTGDRVVIDPTLACGRCEWCLRGEQSLCVEFRILGEHVDGGFAGLVLAPAANLMRVPDGFDAVRAAAAPLTFLTAWRGLISKARLGRNESVLITGASGGVATAAIRIAVHAGARVFAITTGENMDRVRALGAQDVFDRNDPDHRKQLFDRTNRRGCDVVFDSVGQATWHDNIRALVRGGRFVVYGATTGPAAQTDLRFVFWKQIEIMGSTMSNRSEFREVMTLVFGGALEPVIDVVWPLERARDAHERLERGDHFGKIVLVP
jgi:NADPH:quinone reductase-like Zn-dependent oxidoreductase